LKSALSYGAVSIPIN